MSVNSWKLEKGLCRCCHAEGAFKSLSEPSYTLGQVEVFSDMLRQCLDIEVQPVEGVYSETTYTICDACAHRLRDASNFKQQVLQCEERFRDMYKNVKALGDIQVKQETEICAIEYQMKIEQSDDDDDAGMDFGQDGDGDGDEDDNKTVLQLLLEGKKEKGKGKAKPKPKPKPKAKKAVPKPAQAAKPKPAKSKKVEKKEDDTPKKDDDLPFTITIATDGNQDFNCKTCGKTFKNRRYFSQHYSHVHLGKRPKFTTCPMCGEKYTPDTRSAHMESAHGIPAPQCNVCNKKFSRPRQLLAHQKTFHNPIMDEQPFTITIATDGTKDFNCKTCGKTFKNRANFSQHYNHVHLKKRPKFRTCHMCDEKFTSLSRAAHMESAHGIPAPQCNACNRKFSHPFQVLAHQKSYHMGEKSHSCSVCDKKFDSGSAMRKHFRAHLPTKSFKCDICEKAYRWKNHLKRHMVIHLDGRKHVCLVCSEEFAHKSSLTYHMTKRHPEIY